MGKHERATGGDGAAFFYPLGVLGDRILAASTIGIPGLYALFYEERG